MRGRTRARVGPRMDSAPTCTTGLGEALVEGGAQVEGAALVVGAALEEAVDDADVHRAVVGASGDGALLRQYDLLDASAQEKHALQIGATRSALLDDLRALDDIGRRVLSLLT